jgi:uncharacterized protein YvpB
MKKQKILITYAMLLSSMILTSFRVFPDQSSTLATGSALGAGEKEAMLIGEDHEPRPPWARHSPKMVARLRKASQAQLDKYQRMGEISGSDSAVEDPNAEGSSNDEPMTSYSPISEDRNIPEDYVIRLPMEDQYHSQISETQLPNACGPTSLLMTLDYFEIEDALANVIQKHQFAPAQGGYDPNCTANPVCTSPGALVQVAQEEYGLLVEAHEGWTLDEIQESLAAGRPIIADIVWRLADEGPGHFVVIYGIDPEQQMLFYHDPYDGAEMAASWVQFSAAWDGPVDVGDPLQPQGFRFWGMSVSIG